MHSIKHTYWRYVLQNMLGMAGVSFYILADTFFISMAVGADGITALNLVLPLYNFIFAVGAMIGVGSAIRYTVAKSRGDDEAGRYFFNAIIWGLVFGSIFIAIGLFAPDGLLRLLGADDTIAAVGKSYTRIFMMFAPAFMWNNMCNVFVRNDGNPSRAMLATLLSSLFNIVFDYVLMFPLGMGMSGAALATALSPLVGIGICCTHFFSKRNTIPFHFARPSVSRLVKSCQVGVSAFVGEMSSGVTTMVFNYLILGLAGNVGVAAYGVVANTALVATAFFNGVAQGTQPLVSACYGKGDQKDVRLLGRMSLLTALGVAAILWSVMLIWSGPIGGIFNREHNMALQQMAEQGLKLYFIGFFFAGINIVGTSLLSSVEAAGWAMAASLLRGFVAICACAFVMSQLLGMTGVWLAFAAAEGITMIVTMIALGKEGYITSKK